MSFNVTKVVDGDTFEVKPDWEWERQKGKRVRPIGYDAPELWEEGGQAAKAKLEWLILHKQVEIKNPVRVDRGRLICKVYFQGKNLAGYFPEY